MQTLAMMELVQRVGRDIEIVLVDREHLNEDSVSFLDGLIVSGWFMDHPSNWPPNNKKHTLCFIPCKLSKWNI